MKGGRTMAEWIPKELKKKACVNQQAQGPTWVLRVTWLVALVFLVWMNQGFLKPLAMAALFAAALMPFSERLKLEILSPVRRALLLTVGFAITFLLPIGIVAFLAADAGLRKMKTVPQDWFQQLDIEIYLRKIEALLPVHVDHNDVLRVLNEGGAAVGRTVLGVLQNLVTDLPKLTLDNIIILIGVYAFLLESEKISNWLKRLSPLSRKKTEILFDKIGSLCSSVVLAAVASATVQALIFVFTLLILGLPGILLVAMTAFVFSFIPVVGTLPVSLYLVGSALISENWTHVIGLVIMMGVVGVSDNFVRPYVLSGGSAKLHPLIGFLAALGALDTIGFYGLFLGPVVAGAVFSLAELVHDKDG